MTPVCIQEEEEDRFDKLLPASKAELCASAYNVVVSELVPLHVPIQVESSYLHVGYEYYTSKPAQCDADCTNQLV